MTLLDLNTTWDIKVNGQPAAFVVISQLANANGLQIRKAAVATMEQLALIQ